MRDTPAEMKRRQKRLGWILSIASLAVTLGFFVAMAAGAPFLSRVVFGRFVTAANLVAVAILAFFVVSIVVFARRASAIDALDETSGGR